MQLSKLLTRYLAAIKRILSFFKKDLCVVCHENEGKHILLDGVSKCCHACHVKASRRKSGSNERRISVRTNDNTVTTYNGVRRINSGMGKRKIREEGK